MMEQVSVQTTNADYSICIGENLLIESDLLLSCIQSDQVLVITNELVKSMYLDPLLKRLKQKSVAVFCMQDGESHKSFATFEQILTFMIENGFRRNSTILALGGGVVGDISGFVAACYQRGVDFIQLPTTLLAMVDSSVGGKTAINLAKAKNMVGAFYQPKLVITDVSCLKTLPNREYSAGMAEVIKYGLIDDFSLFEWIEEHAQEIKERDPDCLISVIKRCCEIKARIVNQDETEQGVRAILNLGHTFGHALEQAGDYSLFIHGEAVALGTLMAFELACELNFIQPVYLGRVENLFRVFELPVFVEHALDPYVLLNSMHLDKKNISSNIRLVIPDGLGSVRLSESVQKDRILNAILVRMKC